MAVNLEQELKQAKARIEVLEAEKLMLMKRNNQYRSRLDHIALLAKAGDKSGK